jgi:hypothetical protein
MGGGTAEGMRGSDSQVPVLFPSPNSATLIATLDHSFGETSVEQTATPICFKFHRNTPDGADRVVSDFSISESSHDSAFTAINPLCP